MSTPVKVKSGNGWVGAGNSSASVSLGSAPTTGNLLVAVVGADKNSGGYTITGFTEALGVRGSSTSLHILWKVSAGTETSVTFTRGNNSPSGDNLWYAEYSQTGAGTWSVVASANTTYSNDTVKRRSTGTTGPALYDGLAFAAWSVDTWNNIGPPVAYTRGTEQRSHSTNGGGGTMGAGGLYIATDPVSIAGTFQSTFSYSGIADQLNGGVVVFGRQTATSATVNAVKAPATGDALAPIVKGTTTRLYPTPATASAVAPVPEVDTYRPIDPTDIQAHICIGPTDAAPRWRDLSPWLLLTDDQQVAITRGRSDELAEVDVGTLTFNLDNSTGEFTPGRSASSFYPACTTDTQVRLRFPDLRGNHADADTASFEGGVGTWVGFFGSCTVATSATRAVYGTQSGQITWVSSGPLAFSLVKGLVNGRTYTATVWVYVPAGQPAVRFSSFDWGGFADSTVTGAWQQLSVTFTLPTTHSRGDGVFFGLGWTGGAAGQSVWVDGFMVNEGTRAATFTTQQADHNERFTGYVASWFESWPGGSNFSVAQVSAADRIAPLGRHTFNSIAVEECKINSPLAIYPLDEAADADFLSAADASGQSAPTATTGTRGNGGGDAANEIKPLVFGEVGPTGTRTCATFYSGSTSVDHTYLRATWQADPLGDYGWSFDKCLVAAFKVKTAQAGVILRLESGASNGIEVGMDATGHIYAQQATGTTVWWTTTSGGTYADDTWHTATLAYTPGTQVAKLYVDDEQVGTATWTNFLFGPENRTIYVGGKPAGLGLRGSIACAAVLHAIPSDHDILSISDAILTGHINDTSNERQARYMTYAGIPTADQVLDAGAEKYMAHIDIFGTSAWTAMATVNTTEGGVTFARRDGAMQFHDRYAGFNNPAADLIIDQLDIAEDVTLGVDSQLHANRCVATSSAAGKYVAENAADIAKRGVYQRDLEVATTSYESLKGRAEWLVANSGGDPQPRFPSVSVDLTSQRPSIVKAAQTCDLTSRIKVTGMHTATAPAATITQRVEGVSEYISLNGWRMEFNTAPSADYRVLLLDDTTYGTLDADNVLGF